MSLGFSYPSSLLMCIPFHIFLNKNNMIMNSDKLEYRVFQSQHI